VTFAEVYQAVLSGCTRCHGASGNLDMSTQSIAYANLVGAKASGPLCGSSGETRVVPRNSAMSLLYHKVAGTADCGDAMPATPQGTALIQSWIDEGAPND
jgi:hypothetical protein